MMIEDLSNEMRNIQKSLLEYIDDEDNDDLKFSSLIDLCNFGIQNNLQENTNKFHLFLYMISAIAENHKRSTDFFRKIEKILLHYKTNITQTLSDYEIFQIFRRNRRIILFLIEQNMTIVDYYTNNFSESHKLVYANIQDYFSPEIKALKSNSKCEIDDDFNQKRKIGENDSYICHLIRNDFVEDFISHITRNIIPLTSFINPSIFETNNFLLDKRVTLIEYSTFYGSIEIFNYLRFSNVDLTPSLWLYAIHGNNPEIIHILEENQVKPEDFSYKKCAFESIKCHNENFLFYIAENLMKLTQKAQINLFEKSLKYYNFSYEFEDIDYSSFFYFYCKYSYFDNVEILLNDKNFPFANKVNEKSISKKKDLSEVFFLYNSKNAINDCCYKRKYENGQKFSF